jgi:hypothetical protein
MHDIDRVRLETQAEHSMYESQPFESEQFEYGELGTEAEHSMYETGPFESEQFEFGELENPIYGETAGVFTETQEMEFASELLEVTNEAELDRFLGKLINRAVRTVGKAVSSPAGQAIGGILKGAARKVLPTIGSAVGSYLGGERGAQLGNQAAAAAGRMFGLELEGLSAEDREFEVAKRYVSFAGEAVKNLTLTPTQQNPRAAANAAAISAAQTHAPGLLSAAASPLPGQVRSSMPKANRGQWVRRGNKIILYGI